MELMFNRDHKVLNTCLLHNNKQHVKVTNLVTKYFQYSDKKGIYKGILHTLLKQSVWLCFINKVRSISSGQNTHMCNYGGRVLYLEASEANAILIKCKMVRKTAQDFWHAQVGFG